MTFYGCSVGDYREIEWEAQKESNGAVKVAV
jgi:hypothetical protein